MSTINSVHQQFETDLAHANPAPCVRTIGHSCRFYRASVVHCFRGLFLLLFLISSAAFVLAAEEPAFYPVPYHIPERGEIVSYVIRQRDVRFQFLPPPNWQATYAPEENKITFTPRDQAATIVIQFTPWPKTKPAPGFKDLRERALKILPDAVIRREFPAFTSASNGCAFELGVPNSPLPTLGCRTCFFAISGQLIQFTLTMPSGRGEEFYFGFENLVNSFRILEKNPAAQAPRAGSQAKPSK